MMIKGVKFVGRTDETVHWNTKTHIMQEEINDFIDALSRFVSDKLRMETDMTYCQEAVKIIDARNHIFREMPCAATDESEDIYALRDLCHTDEEMNTLPDRQRMLRIARNYWNM